MVDFNRLLRNAGRPTPTDPKELFHTLVRDERLGYLREVQSEVLEEWSRLREQRKNRTETGRDQWDIVIKMNTGSGKTLVGLLLLQACIHEGLGPALYLCPTTQLVEQVQDQARLAGIRTTHFDEGEMPADFLSGSTMLVTTFQKVFNGRSVFGVIGSGRETIQPGCLLIDDAHSCLTIARESSSVTLPRRHPAYGQLFSIFKDSLRQQAMGTATSIESGDPTAYLAVPYWDWQDRLNDVIRVLDSRRDDEELLFKWNLIRDDMALSTCMISGSQIQIAPFMVPVHRVPAIAEARRRLFLSATLVDDSVLLRDFRAAESAVANPLRPKLKGDVGERLVLLPSLIHPDLTRANTVDVIKQIASEGYNTVVLVPSFRHSEAWRKVGAVVADNESIGQVIGRLQESGQNLVVMANRYDGIDLPDNACRLLVLDGLPWGGSLYEQYLLSVRPSSPLLKMNQAQKVEQGMGRGVRSGTDHCAVLLLGSDLVRFLGQTNNRSFMTQETQRQIQIGFEIIDDIRDGSGADPTRALVEVIRQCLRQDTNWKQYHRYRMTGIPEHIALDLPRSLAKLEIDAATAHAHGQAAEAASRVLQGIEQMQVADTSDQGWYIQLAAQLFHAEDKVRSQEVQLRAHEANPRLLRPLAGIRYRRVAAKRGVQATRILAWVRRFSEANAIPVTLAEMVSRLAFGVDHDACEAALEELGEALGFECQRPDREYREGPDVLWGTDDGFAVIEAKNEVEAGRRSISRKEAGQLHNSVTWFGEKYPGQKAVPVLIHPASSTAPDAFPPEGTVVLDQDGLTRLRDKITRYGAILAQRAPNAWHLEDLAKALAGLGLTLAGIREECWKPVRRER